MDRIFHAQHSLRGPPLHGVEGFRHLADLIGGINIGPQAEITGALHVDHGVLEAVYMPLDKADQQLGTSHFEQHEHEHDAGKAAGVLRKGGLKGLAGGDCNLAYGVAGQNDQYGENNNIEQPELVLQPGVFEQSHHGGRANP